MDAPILREVYISTVGISRRRVLLASESSELVYLSPDRPRRGLIGGGGGVLTHKLITIVAAQTC